MKVAFIGTHGVGKTTLCFDLAARLKRLDMNVDIVREVARHCPLPINRDTTLEAQAWILHTQIAQEIAAGSLFKVPVLTAPTFDGTRDVSAGFQTEIDVLIDELMREFGASCLHLDPAHRAGWIDQVLREMGLPTEPPQFDLFASDG
jgi:hypothetical protein